MNNALDSLENHFKKGIEQKYQEKFKYQINILKQENKKQIKAAEEKNKKHPTKKVGDM